MSPFTIPQLRQVPHFCSLQDRDSTITIGLHGLAAVHACIHASFDGLMALGVPLSGVSALR